MKAFALLLVIALICAVAMGYKSEILKEHGVPADELEYVRSPLPHTYLNVADLPESFSWAEQPGVTLTPVRNQHVPQYCGSCWNLANVSALSDRIAIIRKGAWPPVELGPQSILNCGHSAGTCNGGTTPGVLAYMKRDGVTVEDCLNYEARDGTCDDDRAYCKDCSRDSSGKSYCWPLQNYTKVRVDEWASVEGTERIKAEIYARGPVSAGINANGVLNLTNHLYVIDEPICKKYGDGVNHVVSIIGWKVIERPEYDEFGLPTGKTNSATYWQIRNSWGAVHGQNGLGYILAGGGKWGSCLGIESYVYWATPDLSTLPPW